MPKIKMPKSSPSIDMTPMVDLAFLLVTFFMLAAQFKPEELVAVEIPTSIAENEIPPKNIIGITISPDNKILFNVDGIDRRQQMLKSMSAKYKIDFTPQEYEKFGKMGMFGAPMARMKDFINTKDEGERKKFPNLGIPVDSLDNQLRDWVFVSRMAFGADPDNQPVITIKADNNTEYKSVHAVIEALRDNKANAFTLITSLEGKNQ
jgi:biopolymer transport protein ExbD